VREGSQEENPRGRIKNPPRSPVPVFKRGRSTPSNGWTGWCVTYVARRNKPGESVVGIRQRRKHGRGWLVRAACSPSSAPTAATTATASQPATTEAMSLRDDWLWSSAGCCTEFCRDQKSQKDEKQPARRSVLKPETHSSPSSNNAYCRACCCFDGRSFKRVVASCRWLSMVVRLASLTST